MNQNAKHTEIEYAFKTLERYNGAVGKGLLNAIKEERAALVAVAEAAREVLTTLRCVNDFDCLKGVPNLSRALEHLQSLTKGEK